MDSPPSPPRPAADPAAPGWRLLAFVYDAVPVAALLMVASGVLLAINGGRTVERAPLLALAQFLVLWGLSGAYFVASWRRGGQTLGMRPWRLKLVAADGRLATTRALWLRYLVGCVTPLFGWLWCPFDAQRRALCDLAAGTVFGRLREPAPAAAAAKR
jgi:uncharacterized RDD family membrane protein YckC